MDSSSAGKKKCGECGNFFKLKFMDRNVKWCPECRPFKYREARIQYSRNYYIYGSKANKRNQKNYIKGILDNFIKVCDRRGRSRRKHSKILKLRCSGATYTRIAEIYDCSRQNIQFICKTNME